MGTTRQGWGGYTCWLLCLLTGFRFVSWTKPSVTLPLAIKMHLLTVVVKKASSGAPGQGAAPTVGTPLCLDGGICWPAAQQLRLLVD